MGMEKELNKKITDFAVSMNIACGGDGKTKISKDEEGHTLYSGPFTDIETFENMINDPNSILVLTL